MIHTTSRAFANHLIALKHNAEAYDRDAYDIVWGVLCAYSRTRRCWFVNSAMCGGNEFKGWIEYFRISGDELQVWGEGFDEFSSLPEPDGILQFDRGE